MRHASGHEPDGLSLQPIVWCLLNTVQTEFGQTLVNSRRELCVGVEITERCQFLQSCVRACVCVQRWPCALSFVKFCMLKKFLMLQTPCGCCMLLLFWDACKSSECVTQEYIKSNHIFFCSALYNADWFKAASQWWTGKLQETVFML